MLLPFKEPWMLLLKNVADIYRENSGFLSLKRGMWGEFIGHRLRIGLK